MVYCEPYTIFLTYINDLPLIFYDNCDPTQLNAIEMIDAQM